MDLGMAGKNIMIFEKRMDHLGNDKTMKYWIGVTLKAFFLWCRFFFFLLLNGFSQYGAQ